VRRLRLSERARVTGVAVGIALGVLVLALLPASGIGATLGSPAPAKAGPIASATDFTLAVDFDSGTGTGTVTSDPAGISCPATCSAPFPEGTMVTLTATPDPGSRFDHWEGACTADPCTVTMDADKAVTAVFIRQRTLTVTLAGTGSGTVTSDPAGIDCPTTCSAAYDGGTSVTLTATPAPGSRFDGWSGDCTADPCTVTMDGSRDVTATFTRLPVLTVTPAGSGSGTVTSSPGGIDCGSTCSASFDEGTMVTLTATPSAGSRFAGWSGACSGTDTCTVTMDSDQSVTATFIRMWTLTVSTAGSGSGTVTIEPGGVVCASTCSATFDDGTMVTLTASPAAGDVFGGWSGACTGTGSCSLTMNADLSVTATFTAPPRTLTVTKAGGGDGTVASTPPGIDCGSTCSAAFDDGTVVTLSASASPGFTFVGWSGDCAGTDNCTVTMDADHAVTATFTATSPQRRTLLVSRAGDGTGTVTSTPPGIDCGSTCSASFVTGTVVVLTATPAAGSTFAGWSGDCSGTGACTLTMTAGHSVTATFILPSSRILTVTKAGSGTGTVTSAPAGIDCGSTCSAGFGNGTQVTLTATPAAGSTFAGWSGDCSGAGTCTVTMTAAHSVTATFTSQSSRALTVTITGGGSGTVTSAPAGIDCGATCSAGFANGTQVTLTATPASGSTFAGWSGDCTGTGACTLTMNAAHSVTATFSAAQLHGLTVTKRGTGSGVVSSSPAGIKCGSTCSGQFQAGSAVVLTAHASRGSRFTGWSGDCSGTGACTLTMGADHAVGAAFSHLPKPKRRFKAYVPPPYNYDPASQLTWWNSFDVRRIPKGTKVTIHCCPGTEVAFADRSHKAHSKRVSGHRFSPGTTFRVVIQKAGFYRCDLKITILRHTKIVRTWGRTC